jgi:hypothetical protein
LAWRFEIGCGLMSSSGVPPLGTRGSGARPGCPGAEAVIAACAVQCVVNDVKVIPGMLQQTGRIKAVIDLVLRVGATRRPAEYSSPFPAARWA